MSIVKTYTYNQRCYLDNVTRAMAAGVEVHEQFMDVFEAIVSGATYVNWPGYGPEPITGRFLVDMMDNLENDAYRQGNHDGVKWVGDPDKLDFRN